MEKLTIQEEEAMIYIWELGSCFVKDIVAKYPQPAPPYTTVASIIKNLERKQYVTAARVGNTYQYTPAIRERESHEILFFFISLSGKFHCSRTDYLLL